MNWLADYFVELPTFRSATIYKKSPDTCFFKQDFFTNFWFCFFLTSGGGIFRIGI